VVDGIYGVRGCEGDSEPEGHGMRDGWMGVALL
jgi:hypothetical protein